MGSRGGRTKGYANRAERAQKQRRVQSLRSRLAQVGADIAAGRVSVCRGGRRLARLRHHLGDANLDEGRWRRRWQAERMFLRADGEADKPWGNETIRVHPDDGGVEVRLPEPLAHLSNTPGRAKTYRLGATAAFAHRHDEWAAQVATGAVAYEISVDPGRGRWYLDASWTITAPPPPRLDELRSHPTLAVDLNADHLAAWDLRERFPGTRALQLPFAIGVAFSARWMAGHLRQRPIARSRPCPGCRAKRGEWLDDRVRRHWRPDRRRSPTDGPSFAALSLVLLAEPPALVGGLGLIYVPSLVLILPCRKQKASPV